jgi:hypothetical protein
MTQEQDERLNQIIKRMATTQVERLEGSVYEVGVRFDTHFVCSVFDKDKDEALLHYLAQEIALYTSTALLNLMKTNGDRK